MITFQVKSFADVLTHRPTRIYSLLGQYLKEELFAAIDRLPYPNKPALKSSISFKVTVKSLIFVSEHPRFYMMFGVEPHKMTYVRNRVIPIKLKYARNPTPRDIRQGVAFRVVDLPDHPGVKANPMIEKALKQAEFRLVEYILERL
tara:strand:+ start:7145 stop:7582 length:438 start_codon:yes stop_codon:yes gene_type:complete